jgi:hypothetical protein
MIINYTDIRAVRPIAENLIDEKRLAPYIDEADKLYLLPALGATLHKEIETDKTTYATLLAGGYYDADTRHFAGLTQATGYLAYARFVRNQNLNITPFGVVQKQTQYSNPVDEKTIIRVANEAEKIGLEYLHQCVEYLKNEGKIDKNQKIKTIKKFKTIGD